MMDMFDDLMGFQMCKDLAEIQALNDEISAIEEEYYSQLAEEMSNADDGFNDEMFWR